jgi:hypothetical protein
MSKDKLARKRGKSVCIAAMVRWNRVCNITLRSLAVGYLLWAVPYYGYLIIHVLVVQAVIVFPQACYTLSKAV